MRELRQFDTSPADWRLQPVGSQIDRLDTQMDIQADGQAGRQ